MAFIVKRKGKPFWLLRKLDPETGKWSQSSTGYRIDNALETRKAQLMASKAGVKEMQLAEGARQGGGLPSTRVNPAFNTWVPTYLDDHFKSLATARRVKTCWDVLKVFLNSVDVSYPRQVKYHHGEDYLKWRKVNAIHGRVTRHNTALLELKFLSQLMNEAIRREFVEANPLLRLGIAREPQKVKPELSDEDVKKLRAALANRAPWMRRAFEISLYTGCRFNETEIPQDAIDLKSGTLRLCDSKRKETDPRRYFTVPIHPKLRPVLEDVVKKGESHTLKITTREFNTRINRAFHDAGVDASFHSLRVTFVTTCHRCGLSQVEAMRLVNHSTALIHRIYSRLNVDDVRQAQSKLRIPGED
jgi:site-specific recombinase XerD